MSKIKLITVTSHPEHAETLRRSSELHGWDYHCIHAEWRGFGTKLIATYEYLKQHPEVTRFVFADAFDVVVFGTPEEFERKLNDHERMLFSCEKGLWPPVLHPFNLAYDLMGSPFCFVNSGLYYSPSNLFKKIFERFTPSNETDDQFWMNMVWLLDNRRHGYNSLGASAILDREQSVFNSHSFITDREYTYENGRVQIMGNEPVFVHSNGKTKDEKLDELVRGMLG